MKAKTPKPSLEGFPSAMRVESRRALRFQGLSALSLHWMPASGPRSPLEIVPWSWRSPWGPPIEMQPSYAPLADYNCTSNYHGGELAAEGNRSRVSFFKQTAGSDADSARELQ
ncbi:hypothetical protein DTO027B5_1177 [Paecilomyces variotii]|nr:hypothetical protein DTO169C6_7765 [Paecilomyces variotii]KAJ9244589.1 hypothetical protein DTO169E5_1410 [Paecilomyces variotii]KAJ9257174.1 hypothetical protein DTO207G8_2346 [Paecilomyces variotii]KAJ9288974.1 hypothetical protein DTO021C3_3499 [Paecilomyces variotii]KAJ9324039.1 hypothetical protein DTO027B3_4855 [Paecilomyces variotii]